MGTAPRYVFHTVWQVAAKPEDTYDVLTDFERYPLWWPEVKQAIRQGDSAVTVCRSFLPYDLRFVMSPGAEDPDKRLIEGRLVGDLVGFSRWQLEPDGAGTTLVYDQEVTTHKRILNALEPIARPAFKANHALMMRHGEKGLRTYLAGYLAGRRKA